MEVSKSYEELKNEELQGVNSIDDYLFLKSIKDRKLFLEEVDINSSFEIVRHIIQYNKDDKGIPVEERKPIILYIHSVGGSVDCGFEIIDIIQASKTPVYTVNLGFEYSMGCLIGMAGHKRYSFRNSKFLIHDGANMVWDSGAKAQDTMRFYERLEDKTKNFILSNTKITKDEYDKNYRVEWYLFADEAKEKGLVDFIVGEDCELEEVV